MLKAIFGGGGSAKIEDTDNLVIYAKTIEGATYEVDYDAEELISSLRAKLAKATGWAADDFRIIFAGKQLEDHRTVGAMNGYNMSVRTTIHIVKNKKESDSGASNAAVGASAGAGAGAGAGAVTYKQPDYTPGKNVLYIRTAPETLLEIPYNSADTIEVVRAQIAKLMNEDVSRIRIIFAGKQLEDDRHVGKSPGYNIQVQSTLHVILKKA